MISSKLNNDEQQNLYLLLTSLNKILDANQACASVKVASPSWIICSFIIGLYLIILHLCPFSLAICSTF